MRRTGWALAMALTTGLLVARCGGGSASVGPAAQKPGALWSWVA